VRECQVQHRSIPRSGDGSRIGRVEQRAHLFARQVIDQSLIGLLHRNGVHALRLIEARRQPVFQAFESGARRRDHAVGPCRIGDGWSVRSRENKPVKYQVNPPLIGID
jgi:hypothetical protein